MIQHEHTQVWNTEFLTRFINCSGPFALYKWFISDATQKMIVEETKKNMLYNIALIQKDENLSSIGNCNN